MKNKKQKIKTNSKTNREIKKTMKFGDIMRKHPEAAEVFMNEGMHCFGCSMASFETLEQGAVMHGINPDKLVEKINKKIMGKKK